MNAGLVPFALVGLMLTASVVQAATDQSTVTFTSVNQIEATGKLYWEGGEASELRSTID